MNTSPWAIPERSAFHGDPAFYGQRQQQHRGAPIYIEPKAAKAPSKPRGPNDGHGGGRPTLESRSVLAMYEYRMQGYTWEEVGSAFYCSEWFARTKVLEQYPDIRRTISGRGKAAPRRADLDTEKMRQYYEQVRDYRMVAERFGTCVGTVHYRLNGRRLGAGTIDRDNACYFSDAGDRDREALNGR